MIINKHGLATAGLRPGELAQVIDVSPVTVSRYNLDSPQHINPPAAVQALVYVLSRLPADRRADVLTELLAGKHME